MVGDALVFVGSLDREARLAVLRLAARRRTYREIARIMGVSPAAVSKYMSGRMAPSDEAVGRLLLGLEEEELREAAGLILDKLVLSLSSFLEWATAHGLLEGDDVVKALSSVRLPLFDAHARALRA